MTLDPLEVMSEPNPRTAGLACLVGALVTVVGGVATQVARGSTAVWEGEWSYPWLPGTFIALSLLWAITHALIFIGLLGVRRSGAAGPTRAARVGLALVLVATATLFVAELAGIPFSEQYVDDSGPSVVGGLFGLGTLLTAVGLILAGYATIKTGRWSGWRRVTPLVTGVWSLVLIGLVMTDVGSAAIGVYGLCFLALGSALYTQPSPVDPDPGRAKQGPGGTPQDPATSA
jgi:hypothetical protein